MQALAFGQPVALLVQPLGLGSTMPSYTPLG